MKEAERVVPSGLGRPFLPALLFACAATFAAVAQEEPIGARLQHAGISPDAAESFLERLRRNVGTADRSAVCAMIEYPLRDNGAVIADAAGCESRYDDLFTIPVRRAVGRQQFRDLFVTPAGVVVGNGELSFGGRCANQPCGSERDFHITRINPAPGLIPPRGRSLIACRTSEHAVRVTADGSGGADLRLWRTTDSAGPPDVMVSNGAPTPEATGLCAWRAWSFADPTSRYSVAEVACMTRPVPAPMGTVAQVTLQTNSGERTASWCFE